MHPLLQTVAHRPWGLPSGPWVMKQTWHDLLFVHWPISDDTLRRVVPGQLRLDRFDGQCWVGVVPFWMSGVRARGVPAMPSVSRFPELNVRTYVTVGGKPGVYFFSLDAASRAAVWGARAFYHLPYFYAAMKAEAVGEEVAYRCVRSDGSAEFRGRYRPCAAVQLSTPGSLEHWLSERYCLYTVHKSEVYRGEIHHQRWPLQTAAAEIETNTMATAAGIALPETPPLLHFSRRLEVLIWPLRRVPAAEG